ncbi:MAG: sodium ion-translocating decarboxylase subunit beta [Fimbriimonadaceae bacterium]
MLETFQNIIGSSGFGQLHWTNVLMLLLGGLFIFLAITKKYEPLLLIPIGFGILIGNIPYDVNQLSLGVYDGPIPEESIDFYTTDQTVVIEGKEYAPWSKIDEEHEYNARRYLKRGLTEEGEPIVGSVVMANAHEQVRYDSDAALGMKALSQGRYAIVSSDAPEREMGKYPQLLRPEQQNVEKASVLWFLSRGVSWGFFPPLIFLGIGALTDFRPLLSNPKMIFLGAAAQIGIFGSLVGAVALASTGLVNFSLAQAGAISIIGGADGPTAIFVSSKLAPELLGAIALSAYSYMAMVPIIQPPIMRLLTSLKERQIQMAQPTTVAQQVVMLFPICGFLLTALIVPAALPLIGMLFLGNLLRESLVTERLARTASSAFIDIVTILLGVSVGAKTQANNFLNSETIAIFVIGIVAFTIATAGGVIFAKIMNALTPNEKINPLIGAAGVSAVPMAARVAHGEGLKADPQNYLLMHAMGPNVAGVLGSAVAAGVLLAYFG